MTILKKNVNIRSVTAHFDLAVEIAVAPYASKYGIGTEMLHKYKDSNMKAVFHASHSLIAEKPVK